MIATLERRLPWIVAVVACASIVLTVEMAAPIELADPPQHHDGRATVTGPAVEWVDTQPARAPFIDRPHVRPDPPDLIIAIPPAPTPGELDHLAIGIDLPDRPCSTAPAPTFNTIRTLVDGTPVADVQAIVWTIGERWWCDGNRWLDVIECEGLNATAQWDPAHISPTDDAGLAQISWVHGQPGELIAGQWPEAVQTITGNLNVATQLRNRDGITPWVCAHHP